ncbi:hypothetical protein F7734_39925 [Scytonema sp. UIC 10036]|nr:hypothetical protein [Scytonema sp. UIC 10036]
MLEQSISILISQNNLYLRNKKKVLNVKIYTLSFSRFWLKVGNADCRVAYLSGGGASLEAFPGSAWERGERFILYP